MMESCPPIDRLVEIASLPADDRRRQHLEQCPRCRSLLASYRTFARDAGDSAARIRGLRDLDARLMQTLESEVFGSSHPQVTGPEANILRKVETRRPRWLRRALLPRSAVGWIAAAAVLVLIAWGTHETWRGWMPRERQTVVRGPGTATAALTAQVRDIGKEAWLFSWSPVADADGYRVVIQDETMDRRGEFEAEEGANSLAIRMDDLQAAAGEPVLFWRVIALRQGDEIARTRLQALPLR
ncbi:MAG: hypothetical protein KBD56_04220 [Candidatus Eisenbacteria bacterium]|nr:hypothetical protein [Candidatus Eisenbacteria bacterium]